ncbi:MAG: peptidoglycan-associated lipoprotein Pal [Pseudomonadota bacterium]
MNDYRLVFVACATLALGACASNEIPDPDPVYDSTAADANSANSSGFDDEGMGAGEFFGDDAMQGDLTTVIYFDFDQSELRAEYGDLLAQHARQLANDSRMRVRLEGHADERGSREYNIGLGERRSQAVRRMLLIQGATAAQISTVSFGEERPASMGSDEDAYALNRRVEIVYTN